MKNSLKFLSILFIISFLNINLFGQFGPQFDNRGFEQWTNRVSEPTHWHSGGTATGGWAFMLTSQIEQSSQTRPNSSGSKSVRLYPHSTWGVLANGNITNGRMNAGSTSSTGADNYNYTQRSESAHNTPINQLPDSLTIWVCFRCTSTSEKAQVKAVVHGDADYRIIANGTESPANMHVATAALSFNRTSTANGAYTWRRLSIPFNNNGPCTDIRYILMTATTNETPGSGNSSDDLFIDDLLLIYNPTLTMGQLASSSFAPGDAITIPFTLNGTMSPDNLNKAANQVIAQLSDVNGNFTSPTELGRVTTNTSGSITAQIPNVTTGNGYRIRVVSTNYPMVGGNIQQVSIMPTAFTITATADPTGAGNVTGSGNYNQGETCTLTATANNGYTFVNWTKDGTQVSTNPTYSFTVTESATYIAHFSANSYTIDVTASPTNGGTVSGGGTYNYGQSCTVSATAATGYTFEYWRENGNYVTSQANYTFTVTGDRNLEARFSSQNFEITATADPTAGGTISGGGSYQYGSTCTLTATANNGYTFVNWTKDGIQVSTNLTYSFTVTESANYVAHFSANSYTVEVTASPANGGTVSGGGTYNYGQSCTVSATAATGYTFEYWRENGNYVTSQANYTFTVTGDRNLEARFSLQTYSITAHADPTEGGVVTGDGSYHYGETCTLTATANTGYTFVNWTKDGTQVSTNPSYSFTVNETADYVAHFSMNTYTVSVTANPSNGGTVTGGGTYNYGQSCSVHATAATGYTFINWTENGNQVSSQADYTFTVENNRSLVANFSSQSYIITASADPAEGGVVTGSGGYDFGDACTLTATANTGYSFVNWTKNGTEVSTNPTYSFTVTESATYVAHFSINNYMINATADPIEGGTVTGAGNYDYGASCTLTATANENYEFINWTKNDVVVSTDVTYTFEVTASEEYVAHFRYFDSVDEDTAVCQIFPNPFTSSLSITTEKAIKNVRVYDVYGHLLMEKAVSDNHFVFDLSGLSSGSYFMHVDYGDSRSIHRIMKAQ